MGRLDRWAEREQLRTTEERREDRSLALFSGGGLAHVTSVLLPVVGPGVAILIAWRDPFERRHALAALILNLALLAAAQLIGGLAEGTIGLLLQLALLAILIGGAVANIQRLKRGQPPLTG